jgi:ribose transport system substrate-binding protein
VEAGTLLADTAIAETGGQGNILVVAEDQFEGSRVIVEALQTELEANCPDCTVKVVNVPVTEWATNIQTEVQSALVADPEIDFVIPIYDAMQSFAIAGMTAAGRSDIKTASFNGTTAVLQLIADGDVVAATVGESADWDAHAYMDQALRILTGAEPVVDRVTPVRLFDDTNIADAGSPPEENVGYGDKYATRYRELWGVAG